MTMTPKQRIARLIRLLEARLPGSSVNVDAPVRATGSWFVDVNAGDQSLVIELRPKLGFGLSSTPSDGYGEGVDEFFQD